MPTFMIFKNGRTTNTIRGADPRKLSDAVRKLAAEANNAGPSENTNNGGEGSSGSGSGSWLGLAAPKGYRDITSEVDIKGLDLLNADSDFGNARTLFDGSKPSAADTKGKGKGKGTSEKKDWVESDTDEQLMLYAPFQATLKVHSLHITSFPPTASSEDADADNEDDEQPMRPKTLKIYLNRPHVLGFEEADDIPATQTVELKASDWDEATATAKVELRFVKFQNVSSLVIFVVDGDGDGERVRVDRVRVLGESGEKRELGKLEKIGDATGE